MNTRIQGSLAVTSAIEAGGQARIAGSVSVGGDLRIAGILDAPNVKSSCRGLFADAAALREAYPAPRAGWWAMVGESPATATVWVAECTETGCDRQWRDTGAAAPPITVDIDRYDAAIDSMQQSIDNLEHPVATADTDDADLIIAAEDMTPIVTFANGHIRTALFDSSQVSASTGTTTTVVTDGGYRIFQPYNSDADLVYRDAVRRSRYADCVPVVLVCGQSNADGRAPASSAPEWLSSAGYAVEGYRMWSAASGEFRDYSVTGCNGAETAPGSDGTGAGKFSFDPFFARAYIEHFGTPLYAIRQTMGGISIQGQPTTGSRPWTWQPKIDTIVEGCNSMCLSLLARYRAANEWAEAQGVKLVPVAVLWHQGESDADGGYVVQYRQNLMNVVSWIRGMCGRPDLPFVSGYVIRDRSTAYQRINTTLSQLAEQDPYYRAVDMDGHYTSLDGLHYDAAALEYMGTQMFESLKPIL